MKPQPLLYLHPVESHHLPLREVPALQTPSWHSIALGAAIWTALAIPAALLGALAGWLVWIVRHG